MPFIISDEPIQSQSEGQGQSKQERWIITNEPIQSSKSVQQSQPQSMSWGEVGQKAITSIPSSAVGFGKNIIQPVIHPIDTAKGIYSIAKGGVEKLIPGTQPDEKAFEAVGQFFKERYGGIENLKNTIANDPVGFAADLSTVLTGVGGIAGKIGEVGDISKLARVGEITSKIGKYTNPLTLATKAISPVVNPILKGGTTLGKQILGATTGAGPGMIEEAINSSKSFKDAMRGKIPGQEVVENAQEALQTIKNNRAQKYLSDLSKISQSQIIDVQPVNQKLLELMKKYNIKVDPVANKLDYSRIAMGEAGRKDIQEIVNTVAGWGTKEGDFTVIGLDALKRQLDDFYSESSQARAFVAQMRGTVKDTIVKNVPQYGEMTKSYAEASNLIKDIEAGLMLRKQGMTGRVTGDMTLRRLTSAMRENFEMRRDLLDALGKEGGSEIASQVAGYSANQIIPKGLVGKLAGSSGIYLTYLNPKFLPLLAMSSPRVVGEFLSAYGSAVRQMQKVKKIIPPNMGQTISKTLFQTGRAVQIPQQSIQTQENQ